MDLMDDTPVFDLLAAPEAPAVGVVGAGMLTVTLAPESAVILALRERLLGGYRRYKRIG